MNSKVQMILASGVLSRVHLPCADDCFIVVQATLLGNKVFKKNYGGYCIASGQSINFGKSAIYFSKDVDVCI